MSLNIYTSIACLHNLFFECTFKRFVLNKNDLSEKVKIQQTQYTACFSF
jgi:hypothetical protein